MCDRLRRSLASNPEAAQITPATATPARNAATRASTELGVKDTLNQDGARPWPTIQLASSGAPAMPSRQPAAEPPAPTSAASAHTIRITCFGVAPMVRSSARSRRRCATDSAKAVAVTATATKAEIRAATPRKVVSPVSSVVSCTAPGSASCRLAPVRTCRCTPGSSAA